MVSTLHKEKGLPCHVLIVLVFIAGDELVLPKVNCFPFGSRFDLMD